MIDHNMTRASTVETAATVEHMVPNSDDPSPWALVAAAMNLDPRQKRLTDNMEKEDRQDRPESTGNKNDTEAELDKTVKMLLKEIEVHELQNKDRSYLSKAFDLVYSPDSKTLKELKRLSNDYAAAVQKGDASSVEKMGKEIEEKIKEDMAAVLNKSQVDRLASEFTKMMFMFVNGYTGLAGTIAAYSLDQMRPGSSVLEQVIDGSTGAVRGALMRGLVNVVGRTDLPVAAKGVALGASYRMLELGLNPRTYFDNESNSYDLKKGLSTTFLASFNPSAIMTDAAIFAIAHGASSGINSMLPDTIAKSPMLAMMSTGYVFGATSGAIHELNRQKTAGEELDLSSIAWLSTRDGALSALAASLGGLQAEMAWRKTNEYLFVKEGENGKFSFAKTKYYEVKARQVSDPAGEYVKSLENGKQGEFAAKGSWVVERSANERYPISPKEFDLRWQAVPGKPGVFSPKPVPTSMVELSKPVDIKTSWGDMHGNAGDFLVRYEKGNFAIVARNVLPETYAGMDTLSIAKLQEIKLKAPLPPVSSPNA